MTDNLSIQVSPTSFVAQGAQVDVLLQVRSHLNEFIGDLNSLVMLLQEALTIPASQQGLERFGVALTVGGTLTSADWTQDRLNQAKEAIRAIIAAMSRDGDWLSGALLFMTAFGGTEIRLTNQERQCDPPTPPEDCITPYAETENPGGRIIYLYTEPEADRTQADIDRRYVVHTAANIVHEFGHTLAFRHGSDASEIYLEWQQIWQLISDFNTDLGWANGLESLQNRSTIEDVEAGLIERNELEHERIANMFEAWVYNRLPDVGAESGSRRQRAAYAMWIFMFGECLPENVNIDLRSQPVRPCGTGFLEWIRQYGGR
jgi:hypothetical protein